MHNLSACLALFAISTPAIANSGSGDIVLSIKPGLCLLATGETECRDSLLIKWKARQPYSLCLYQETADSSLYCWSAVREGEYQFEFAASETTDFELRDQQSDQLLISKSFKILTRETGSRRRNPWSFF